MKTDILLKRLSKKELKTIAGGMLDCMPAQKVCLPHMEPCNSNVDENGCAMISPHCGQKICRP
ncbi:hypothetical protein DRF65_15165 [Chryseobacterium pennae]|uniref:Bacteriocin n=1 Tax=Chryseobacterium pennae TaxID=2258962 RepID=A0A3D9C750_9FLAO|nr:MULTISPECIES: bacteriocin [Chryseobacterium]MCS4300589.1 bacteriocin-like protein [Chryseobacterium sp. BIGb0232]REC61528.1 hypothetical protein DRF65_15165 [Chryseobacterium pennae]ROS20525.1 bacteriocin-like protein [Chryseobacterium nakagawai]